MPGHKHRSNASKKAWRSRKRRARVMALTRETIFVKQPVGYAAILAATTPDKSSAVIARELGLSSAYIRKAWSRLGLPKRHPGLTRGVETATND